MCYAFKQTIGLILKIIAGVRVIPEPHHPVTTPSVSHSEPSCSTFLPHRLPEIPWDRVPRNLIEDCKNNKPPTPGKLDLQIFCTDHSTINYFVISTTFSTILSPFKL